MPEKKDGFVDTKQLAPNLSRFRLSDERLISNDNIKAEIAGAFSENRAFRFYPDPGIIENIRSGQPLENLREDIVGVLRAMYDTIADGNETVKNRFLNDALLSKRLVSALNFFHIAAADTKLDNISKRRIVIIKEKPGIPTIFHVSDQTTVISRVGQGPAWAEIPTIYLGLNIFDTLSIEHKKGQNKLFESFKILLMVEERAIETGFSHVVVHPPHVSEALNYLVDRVIKHVTQYEIEIKKIPREKPFKKFTKKNRDALLKDLNARLKGDELNFDYKKCLRAVQSLEKLSRLYKNNSDIDSIREVVKLLVAASGHDIHEIRNRACIILERIFSPKEFDAPLAVKFINTSIGTDYAFSFDLPETKWRYILRIYKNSSGKEFILNNEIDSEDIELFYDKDKNRHSANYKFEEYGHYDFAVLIKKKKKTEWVSAPETSGRVNVLPDLKGRIILEIFTDIHGHTKAYWHDDTGHPGLLYNENGEVIRLGNFEDVSAHLEDIKNKYCITDLYLLGVQKRGFNKENWAPEATSPSPFSPMSLTEIEPKLGGEKALKALVKKAHSLDIKIILDIIPHINRKSERLPESLIVKTYGTDGKLYARSATDGRYGSWDDGKLVNFRKFEVWQWIADSITTLIEKFDIDGIRFDSAHAVPVMMKKNNFLYVYDKKRTEEDMVEGGIIVNDRENGHFITTGYYDSECRDRISVPFHYYIMLAIQKKLKEKNKNYFINIAECYWGHERFLTRTGLIPYNSALFKICENIIHGKSDVREIYHIYDNYFPSALPEGTELLGILGNHDERRALNTFGHRGLRPAVALTSFMSSIIMDYEGSAEGEGWKVFLDNIYVNWNQFEYASHRSLESFYREWYRLHRNSKGKGYLVWANNNMVAASMKFTEDVIWLGAFNFADSNQYVSIQFDNPALPVCDNAFYKISDIVFSEITGRYSYYKGSELKISRLNTVVSYTDRIKLLKLEKVDIETHYRDFIKDSFNRLCEMSDTDKIFSNFSFSEMCRNCGSYGAIEEYLTKILIPLFHDSEKEKLEYGLKRAVFYLYKHNLLSPMNVRSFSKRMIESGNIKIRELGKALRYHNERGPVIFMSAEAEPFSKSGGLANVVYELPREMSSLGEDVYVITGYYKNGSQEVIEKMNNAVKKYNIKYTGKNVRFMIMDAEYEAGVHYGIVDGIRFFLLDHHEFFDGLYWGITAAEKLRRRIAFARACAEVIVEFNIAPHFSFTNDAYAGIFNGIIKCDYYYMKNPNFLRTTFFHIIHNCGWQYFDAYDRFENGFDLFNLFNLPHWLSGDFSDPVFHQRLNCMAAGIRFADRVITVSPSYALQIEYASDGMEHILHDVIGISNALGRDFRKKLEKKFRESGFVKDTYPLLLDHIKNNAPLRKKIEAGYGEILKGPDFIKNIENKKRKYILDRMLKKLLLQYSRGLTVDPDIVLCSMIHRISEQKGFQLLLDASEGIFKNLGFQAIIGGAVSSGDGRGGEIAHGLYLLSRYYQKSVNVSIGFQDVTIPLLASDLFLMPSMHEPGGISQLEALASGCLVVARATGGLRDTVFPLRTDSGAVTGNGFLFSDFSPWAFYDAMERAAVFFKNQSGDIVYQARINAEKSVCFWDTPAKKYINTIYNLTEKIRIID